MPKAQQKLLPKLPERLPEPVTASLTQVPEKLTDNNYPKTPLTEEEQMEVYYKAQIFKDEALETFPLYTVQIHKPNAATENRNESTDSSAVADSGTISTNNIAVVEDFGPKPGEIWVRIKPENANEMKEIMAQTADLYREYTNTDDGNVTIINWVGGQPYFRMDFDASGNQITP